MEKTPMARLARIQRAVPGLGGDAQELVESWSNDVWVSKSSVLRVCWRADRERLLREHRLLDALPASLAHPRCLASGRVGDLTWSLLERIPGRRLDLVWPELTDRQQHQALVDQGIILRELHDWSRSEVDLGADVGFSTEWTDGENVGAAALVPLPVERTDLLLKRLSRVGRLESILIDLARRRINQLGDVDPFVGLSDSVLVHGDAHFANYLWDQGALTLIDFEWARRGPSDLELEAICREDPEVERWSRDGPVRAEDLTILVALGESYPALLAREHLTERLWLYDVAHQIRKVDSVASAEEPTWSAAVGRLVRRLEGPRICFP